MVLLVVSEDFDPVLSEVLFFLCVVSDFDVVVVSDVCDACFV